MSTDAEPVRVGRWPDGVRPMPMSAKIAFVAVTMLYLFLIAHRPVYYIADADYDDALFTKLALNLASGHWLGGYNETTLIKGIGFPFFLAVNYLIGLPANLSLCLLYTAACFCMGAVLRPFIRSDAAGVLLFAALLFIPPLSSYATIRMNREFFYAAMTLATLASAVNLVFGRSHPRSWRGPAALTGGLAAWTWLTREEGVWLLPALAFLALAGAMRPSGAPRSVLIRAGAALVTALLLIGGVGLVNRLVYGRFVVNETTSAPFQSALSMLQKASYPDWKPHVPVPLAARTKLYAQSPSFRRLKPFLDPDDGSSVWIGSGCDEQPAICGELGGGWFLWAFRDAAAKLGVFGNPTSAARFFRQVETEVAQACAQGRLLCARWMLPLVPPFTRDQIETFPTHLYAAARLAILAESPGTDWPQIAPLRGLELQQAELVSVPEHGPGRIIVLAGTWHGAGDALPTVAGLRSTQVIDLERKADPAHPEAAGADLRFTLTLACLMAPCAIRIGDAPGVEVSIEPPSASLKAPIAIGAERLSIDSAAYSPLTLRTRAANAWNRILPVLEIPFRILVVVGLLGYVVNLIGAIASRSLPPIFAIALALALAVACRAVLLALVDATSFPALDYDYMAAALPLTVCAAVLSTVACYDWLREWCRRGFVATHGP